MANPNDAKVLLNQLQEEQFLALHDVYALLKEKYPSVHQYLKECEVLNSVSDPNPNVVQIDATGLPG